MKLATHLYQELGLRMSGNILPFPSMLSWHAQRQFYLYITLPESMNLKSISHNRANRTQLLVCLHFQTWFFSTSMVTDIHTSTPCTYIHTCTKHTHTQKYLPVYIQLSVWGLFHRILEDREESFCMGPVAISFHHRRQTTS
jgi:hypothetical protein